MAGELVNDGRRDWPHIAEKVATVGRSHLSLVRPCIIQALAHDRVALQRGPTASPRATAPVPSASARRQR